MPKLNDQTMEEQPNVGHYVKSYLDSFQDKGKFDQFVALDNANSKTIARLGQFISKSISSQSQSLGTGGPSQTIDFNNGSLSI